MSSSSLELEEQTPSPEGSAEDKDTGEAGEPPLEPSESLLLVSSQYGSRRLPPASNARIITVSSPSNDNKGYPRHTDSTDEKTPSSLTQGKSRKNYQPPAPPKKKNEHIREDGTRSPSSYAQKQ